MTQNTLAGQRVVLDHGLPQGEVHLSPGTWAAIQQIAAQRIFSAEIRIEEAGDGGKEAAA